MKNMNKFDFELISMKTQRKSNSLSKIYCKSEIKTSPYDIVDNRPGIYGNVWVIADVSGDNLYIV